MDNQQGPTGILLCVLRQLGQKGSLKFGAEGTSCICMAGSLSCSPEMIIILLMNDTTVQNKKLKKNG